ncbi:MAG: toprim domain-containing protein, partial [Thermoplasmata archaeon]
SMEGPVVVEGERDVRALRALGIGGDIMTLHRGVTLFRLCEDLAADGRPVVIMTDWDLRGGKLAKSLREGLAANGVKYDNASRARLAVLTRGSITAVEDLDSFVENLRPRDEDGRRRLASNKGYYARRR